MYIKFFLLKITFFSLLTGAYCQKLKLEHTAQTYTYQDNSKCSFTIISGSFFNLKALVLANMDVFRTTMMLDNYTLATDGSGYIAKTVCKDQDYYLIKKSTGQISFIYGGETDITSLRTEINQLYPNVQPRFVSGFEIYPTPVNYNGLIIKLQVYIQEGQAGGGSITIKRF